jgi:hypothetical protein
VDRNTKFNFRRKKRRTKKKNPGPIQSFVLTDSIRGKVYEKIWASSDLKGERLHTLGLSAIREGVDGITPSTHQPRQHITVDHILQQLTQIAHTVLQPSRPISNSSSTCKQVVWWSKKIKGDPPFHTKTNQRREVPGREGPFSSNLQSPKPAEYGKY